VLWIPLILLQVTVAMRVVGGILEMWELRRWSAMLNALTLALFVVVVVVSVARGEILRRSDAATVA
jgi:predicted small integral membrane protein